MGTQSVVSDKRAVSGVSRVHTFGSDGGVCTVCRDTRGHTVGVGGRVHKVGQGRGGHTVGWERPSVKYR